MVKYKQQSRDAKRKTIEQQHNKGKEGDHHAIYYQFYLQSIITCVYTQNIRIEIRLAKP